MISAGRVLLMPKGAYNPSTTYEMLDIVSYNGSSYIAKGTTTGNLPTDTTYWQLSAYGGQAANMAGNFAELEVTSVASMTHYADDIFVDENSQLMKATQTINIGDTIDVNTNCTPTTVEALLISLSARMDSLDSVNRKIQGAIEIAAQTDLHSLALGEYYKKQTSFYVTNAPTGIDQDPTAIFRLTVEAALDNASQASSPLILTLRTPDGKIYTQGFDGTIWGSWKQIADKSSLDVIEARVDAVEDSVADVETSSTASKAYAIGESFYYNDVLYKATAAISQGGTITPGTNCTPEKIIEKIDELVSENQTLTNNLSDEVETRAKLGAHNRLPLDLATIKSLNTSGTWSGNAYTVNNVTFTVNDDFTITANTSGAASATAFLALASNIVFKAEDYILSAGSSIDGQYSKYGLYLQRTGQADITTADETKKHFVLSTDTVFTNCKIFVANGESVTNLVFKPMVTLSSDPSTAYTPYAMTNRELTESMLKTKLFGNIAIDSLTLAAGATGDVKKNANNISYADLGLKAGSIKAVILTWSTGHVCVPTQIYASGGDNIILSLYNPSSSSVTVTQVDLQVLYTE